MRTPQLPKGVGILILLYLLYQFFFNSNWSEKWYYVKIVSLYVLMAVVTVGLFWLFAEGIRYMFFG